VSVPDLQSGRFHYVGIGGSGMSALAQFQVMRGGLVSGSDRAFDANERSEWRARLERLGIAIYPQDGSGIGDGCVAVVVSSAVETQIPDVQAARARGLPILHRSELLAHHVETFHTIAVSGTSGKSTVVAMVFEILDAAGRQPSVITGGELVSLQTQGHWGNASSKALETFKTFRLRTRGAFVVGEDVDLEEAAAGVVAFGWSERAAVRAVNVAIEARDSRFEVDGVRFEIPTPGRYNVENALAAIATCRAAGVDLEAMVAPLAAFRGVGRRFQTIGVARDVEVVDDFAHNPNKIRAALGAAQLRAGRVHAIYQPHGYGPTRFHRAAMVETFAEMLRPDDRLSMLEVYYAGGTTTRDFSAADIVDEIAARGAAAVFAPSRKWLIDHIASNTAPADLVLVMGARDPTLTELADQLLEKISTAASRPSGAPM